MSNKTGINIMIFILVFMENCLNTIIYMIFQWLKTGIKVILVIISFKKYCYMQTL